MADDPIERRMTAKAEEAKYQRFAELGDVIEWYGTTYTVGPECDWRSGTGAVLCVTCQYGMHRYPEERDHRWSRGERPHLLVRWCFEHGPEVQVRLTYGSGDGGPAGPTPIPDELVPDGPMMKAWPDAVFPLVELVGRLVELDPWESSQEGLDDGCHFCYSDRYAGGGPEHQHRRLGVHELDCAWVAGRRLLGLDLMGHTVTNDESNGAAP